MALPKWYIEIKAGSNVRDPSAKDGATTEMWSSFSISRACIAAVVNYGLILSRVQRQAIVKVCGCRPMTTAPRPLGPASANLQGRCYGAGVGEDIASVDVDVNRCSTPMQKLNDLGRSLTPLKPDRTLIAVIEMSLSSWLVAGIVASSASR